MSSLVEASPSVTLFTAPLSSRVTVTSKVPVCPFAVTVTPSDAAAGAAGAGEASTVFTASITPLEDTVAPETVSISLSSILPLFPTNWARKVSLDFTEPRKYLSSLVEASPSVTLFTAPLSSSVTVTSKVPVWPFAATVNSPFEPETSAFSGSAAGALVCLAAYAAGSFT